MSLDFEDCLKLCIKKENEIISKLIDLKEEVQKFHTTCNAVRTGGTVVSAVGTGALVVSVLAAPFTGGLSLVGTATGLVSTVAGGVTNAVTDVVDRFKTKEIIKNIEDLVESKEDATKRLRKHFETIDKIQKELVENGIDQVDALFNILKGIANRTLRTDDVTNINFFKRFVTTIVRVPHTELLAGGTFLAIKSLQASAQNAKIVSNLFNVGTKTSTAALKTVGKVSAVISVAVTLVDIALLIKDWTSDHLTVKVIDEIMDKLSAELKQLKDILDFIQSLKLTVVVTRINEIPVVATNEYMIKIGQALFSNQLETFKNLLKQNEIDFSLFDQTLIDNLGKRVLDNLSYRGYTEQLIKDTLDNYRGKLAAKNVTVLQECLLEQLEFDKPEKKERSSRGEHVIKNKVINVYQEIIDQFVKQQFNCTFPELTKIPAESIVYRSYYSPIDEIIKNNIKTVMVARIPSEYIYIDVNAVIYEVAILFLRHIAKVHLAHIYKSNVLGFLGSKYTRAIRGCVDFMNAKDVYVDKIALEFWVKGGGDRRVYIESRHTVELMLEHLYDKMAIWVTEIRAFYPN